MQGLEFGAVFTGVPIVKVHEGGSILKPLPCHLFLGDVGFHVIGALVLKAVGVVHHIVVELVDWLNIHQLFCRPW